MDPTPTQHVNDKPPGNIHMEKKLEWTQPNQPNQLTQPNQPNPLTQPNPPNPLNPTNSLNSPHPREKFFVTL
jgi:hypothetical protein